MAFCHIIKEHTNYPPFFITVSTEDNRVGPGHARKLAARLEQVGAKAYYVEETGKAVMASVTPCNHRN